MINGARRQQQFAKWVAPGFLITIVAVFILAPWSLKDKLDAVCFGI
jgi:hypothetical protein